MTSTQVLILICQVTYLFDISKAFDKVWHNGLISKLKSYDVDGLLKLVEHYLTGRQETVVLNGQTSSWKNELARVLQVLC